MTDWSVKKAAALIKTLNKEVSHVLFLMRCFYWAKNTFFAPKPNREGAAF